MKKRLTSLVVAVVVLVGMLPMTAFASVDLDLKSLTVDGATVYQADAVGQPGASTGVGPSCRYYAATVSTTMPTVTVSAASAAAYVRICMTVQGSELSVGDSFIYNEDTLQIQGTTGTAIGHPLISGTEKLTLQIADNKEFTNAETYALWLTYAENASTETPAAGYTVGLSVSSTDVTVGEDVRVSVNVSAADTTAYNAYDVTLCYDPARLTYHEVIGADENTYEEVAAGTVRIVGYGTSKPFDRPAATVRFTANAVGTADVTLTEATVSQSAQVETNAPDATITDETVSVTVSNYNVQLSQDFVGAETAVPGAAYVFDALDPYYKYSFNATMGGQAVTVQDNGGGKFAIADVSGNLVIRAEKVPIEYTVALKLYSNTGEIIDDHHDVTYAAKAVHDTDYTFTVHKESAHIYTVSVTIGQTEYPNPVISGDTYTIPGEDINGDITLIVTKQLNTTENAKLRFEGEGAGDVVMQTTHYPAGSDLQVAPGQDITFTLRETANYDYTVTLGDTELFPDSTGVYTIRAERVTVGATIVVNVDKTLRMTVEWSEYLTLSDGTKLYRIAVTCTPAAGLTLTYDGSPMYRREGQYFCLVKGTEPPTQEQIRTLIAETGDTEQTLPAGYDINGTGRVDINDVQMVYDMYMKNYPYSDTTAKYFLRADVNDIPAIDLGDCVAIVDHILNGSGGVRP